MSIANHSFTKMGGGGETILTKHEFATKQVINLIPIHLVTLSELNKNDEKPLKSSSFIVLQPASNRVHRLIQDLFKKYMESNEHDIL